MYKANDFTSNVYAVVGSIPAGYVATYGQIATACGKPRAARVVGSILKRAPAELDIPCHRVVNRLGKLAPEHVFGDDKQLQRILLESEGVTFLGSGHINMGRHLWSLS